MAATPPAETFPIDLKALKPLKLDPSKDTISDADKETLRFNLQLCRDAIVFFTALAGAKGLSGHSGGAYDTVPEVLIVRAFIDGGSPIVPMFLDEAGHRVATQYLLSVLDGAMPAEKLLHYREAYEGLPGHPERDYTPGVKFSSGRLGHVWAMANGIAMANPGKSVIVLGSDGSQMEGDNAEAARLCVGKELNVKVLVDDNNVTIAGHPFEYMPGFELTKTFTGHGMTTETVMGEDIDALYTALSRAFSHKGPYGLVIKRKMAPGIEGAEGSPHAHEVLKAETAIKYLEKRGAGYERAIEMLKNAKTAKSPLTYKGSSGVGKNRDDFGKIVNEILEKQTPEQRLASVRVFDNDLEGSCGLHHIRKKFPDVFVRGGIMERGNFSAAAGFGFEKGKQGVFATFSAFLEMCVSEITMARLNHSNVLAHFSHSGVDDMADNTCHFGINSFFADGGINHEGHEDSTRLYFPVDQHQFAACINKIWGDPGLRFLFSTRSPVPDILDEAGNPMFKGKDFAPGKDDLVREAPAGGGYIVSFGETLYRALDAVIALGEQGTKAGLINKPTLNIYDPESMKRLAAAPWVLVAEGYNVKTGLGSRFGSALLKAGFKGKYNHIGTHKEGCGGLWEQMPWQGLDSVGIQKAAKALAQAIRHEDAGARGTFGMLGLIAALGMGVGDLLMLARPISGREFVQLGLANPALVPEGRLIAGAVCGVIFSTLYIPGFWQVAQAAASSDPRRAFAMFYLFCATTIFGAAFHATSGFAGVSLQAIGSISGSDPTRGVPAPFRAMTGWLALLGMVAMLGGSLCFVRLVATGRSRYPRWFAWCSPFVLVIGCAALGWLAPAPVGGFLWPVAFNLAMVVFFALSLRLTAKSS